MPLAHPSNVVVAGPPTAQVLNGASSNIDFGSGSLNTETALGHSFRLDGNVIGAGESRLVEPEATWRITDAWHPSLLQYVASLAKSSIDVSRAGTSYLELNKSEKLQDVAVLCIDIVDSTNALEKVEAQGKSSLEWVKAVFRPLVQRLEGSEGRIMDVIGDALIVVFPREHGTWAALSAAFGILYERASQQQHVQDGPNLRIGIACGNVEIAQSEAGCVRSVSSTVNKACHAHRGAEYGELLEDSGHTQIFIHASTRALIGDRRHLRPPA